MLHTQHDFWEILVLVFIAVQFICVCFPPVKEATHTHTHTHTPIDLHMFVFTKVDLPINRMIPQWESAYIHVYMKNAFSMYVYNYIHHFFCMYQI